MRRQEIELQHIVPLPTGYTQVNYLRAYNSNSYNVPYINTNFLASNNTSVEIKFLTEWNYCWVFGGRTSAAVGDLFSLAYSFDNYPNATTFAQFGNISGEFVQYPSQIVNVISECFIDKNGAFVNGTRIDYPTNFNHNSWQGTKNVYLFNLNNNGNVSNGLNGQIYYCKLLDKNVLKRDMIPAVRNSDSKSGFWDLCGSICPLTSSPFYVKAGGTGEFSWG